MQVGQMNQTVEITTEAPTVELTSSELSATVNSTTVRELPCMITVVILFFFWLIIGQRGSREGSRRCSVIG